MNIAAPKVLAIEIGLSLIAAPLVAWLVLYAAACWWRIGLRPVLPWLRILRWTGWGLGIALFLVHLARNRFPVIYGIAMFSFSGRLIAAGGLGETPICS
jgi:hypothetical protein